MFCLGTGRNIYRTCFDFSGIFVFEKHTGGDYVVRECAFKDKQVMKEMRLEYFLSFPENFLKSNSHRYVCETGIRCLEEGAEEFFLKPVRLSDLNRLRPHLMKTKLKDQKPETEERPENPEIQHHQEQQQLQDNQIDDQQTQPPPAQPQLDQQQQQSLQAASNNKRKAIEQGLSPETDRTRPRYSGIATVV